MPQKGNELGQFIPLHYHYQMIADTSRMTAFRNAIEQVILPKHKVVDLGSGTGVLSFFAAKQGARVWAVEYNPSLASASRKFLKENGLSDRVQVFESDASDWLPPEPADLVICEMLHSALLREKQVQVISAFRDAHYTRFGTTPKILPSATLLGVQPVLQCYDFNGFTAPVPLFQSPYCTIDNCCTCSDPVVYKIVDYDNAHVETYESNIFFSFQQDTNVNALRFITKNLLTIDLSTGQTIDWHSQYLILPLYQSIQLQAGQSIQVRFSYKPGDDIETLNNSINVDIIDAIPAT
jgi:predicted RNA methylase